MAQLVDTIWANGLWSDTVWAAGVWASAASGGNPPDTITGRPRCRLMVALGRLMSR